MNNKVIHWRDRTLIEPWRSNSRLVSDKFRMALRTTHFAPQPGR
jgi:hypothetical protein